MGGWWCYKWNWDGLGWDILGRGGRYRAPYCARRGRMVGSGWMVGVFSNKEELAVSATDNIQVSHQHKQAFSWASGK